MKKEMRPPKWLDWLLELYCKPEMLEDLQGDLHEYFHKNLEKGKWYAIWIYFLDVLKFFKPYVIRKPKIMNKMSWYYMLGNYTKTSVRSMARNRLFTSINVFGLAVSMSVGILMITYITELLSFDTFHEKKDRTYRIITTYEAAGSDHLTKVASTSVFIGNKLRTDYAGIEDLSIIIRGLDSDITYQDRTVITSGYFAEPDFFKVFSFEMIAGNPETALANAHEVVLTESLAQKLFKEEYPVGKQIEVNDLESYGSKTATVVGVVKDPPTNSHMQFELLASLQTQVQHTQAKPKDEQYLYEYDNVWMNYVYLTVPEGVSVENLQASLDQIAAIENEKYDWFNLGFRLEPLLAIVPGDVLSNQIGPEVSWKNIYFLAGLTLIVLISACFNYTNLSIARSLRRAREVGVRKVIGAAGREVFTQFIVEAVIVAMISLFLAVGLYYLMLPAFKNVIISNQPITMDFKWIHLLYFLGFVLLVGTLAGVLPAWFLSRLKAISVMKDVSRIKLFGAVNVRKALIVFQFALSIGFISTAVLCYRQYEYALNFDLGFQTENILNVRLKGNDAQVMKTAFAALPEVKDISRSAMVPATGEYWGFEVKYDNPQDSVNLAVNYVDKEYLRLHEYEFLAGDNFIDDLAKDEKQKYIIVNEKLLDRIGIASPEEAIGEHLKSDDMNLEIVGVLKDFQGHTISGGVEPYAFLQSPSKHFLLNLKVQTTDILGLMNKLQVIWDEHDKVHPFEADFYHEKIRKAYSEFKMYFTVIGYLAALAVSISVLGLLGMAVFTTETRIKEVTIRKVLGATAQQLMLLLSKGFAVLILIATLIALPVTYYVVDQYFLADYVNRITIGLPSLLSGVIVILVVGGLMIGWQTWLAAQTNPAKTLRNE